MRPSTEPLRLLHLVHSLDPAQGGIAEALRQIVSASPRDPVRHAIVTLDDPSGPHLRALAAEVHALGPGRGGYGYTGALVPWLRSHASDYDAVLVHGLWQYHGLAAWRALRGSGSRYFVFCHGMLDPWFRTAYPLKHLKKWLYWPWAEYRVLRDAAAVLFTCEEESRLAPRSFGLYRARHAVAGLGIALDRAAESATPELFLDAFPAARHRHRLLFIGRIHAKKGCDLLIDAFARAAARDPQLHLVMAGPDAAGWRAALEARAAALDVADRITWCGMLTGALKWSAFRAADAFALPSHQENFGIAVVEALAMGVPVLISDKVNIWRETEAAGAALVAPDDATGTQALLDRWLALPAAQREAMAHAARACFAKLFQADAAAQRLVDVVRQHLSDP